MADVARTVHTVGMYVLAELAELAELDSLYVGGSSTFARLVCTICPRCRIRTDVQYMASLDCARLGVGLGKKISFPKPYGM